MVRESGDGRRVPAMQTQIVGHPSVQPEDVPLKRFDLLGREHARGKRGLRRKVSGSCWMGAVRHGVRLPGGRDAAPVRTRARAGVTMDMTDDDLNAPLGQFPVRKRPSLVKMSYLGIALAGLGLFGAFATYFPWPGKPAPTEYHAGIGFRAPGMDSHKTLPRESAASPQRSSSETSASPPNTP
ncbi:MAG TPA: hypothetical protein VMU78_08445, partial [Methylocella sp.]|nr:hypothetical protein [Methylocella sp.]